MRHPGRARPSRGFSLIELLVVIGIIALLIGLLIAGLSKARASASRAKCQEQLRQIGIAFRAYLNDSDDRWPNPYIHTVLPPYVGEDPRVFECPSDEDSDFRKLHGTSYVYYVWYQKTKPGIDASTKIIVRDAFDFHTGTHPKNALYLDGHVELLQGKGVEGPVLKD